MHLVVWSNKRALRGLRLPYHTVPDLPNPKPVRWYQPCPSLILFYGAKPANPNLVRWYQPCQPKPCHMVPALPNAHHVPLQWAWTRVGRGRESCTNFKRGFNWVPMNKVWATRGTWIKMDSNLNGIGLRKRVYNNTHSCWVIQWWQPHKQWHQSQSQNPWLKKTSKQRARVQDAT